MLKNTVCFPESRDIIIKARYTRHNSHGRIIQSRHNEAHACSHKCNLIKLTEQQAYQHIEAKKKLPPFCRQHFQMHFLKISLQFVPRIPNNDIPALIEIMAWCRPGNKPLSEPMMAILLTYICITRPWWVKFGWNYCLTTFAWIIYTDTLEKGVINKAIQLFISHFFNLSHSGQNEPFW